MAYTLYVYAIPCVFHLKYNRRGKEKLSPNTNFYDLIVYLEQELFKETCHLSNVTSQTQAHKLYRSLLLGCP